MSTLVSDLIAQARLQSGLRNNQLFSDDQIAGLLTEGYSDLRDKVDARLAFWFKSTYDFTLSAGNTLDLTLIPDLLQIQYVNRVEGTVKTTVDALSSVTERNRYSSALFGLGGRRYFADGDELEILPGPLASGSYELVYTPQYQALAVPHTRSFAISSSDSPLADGSGNSGFNFANANFSAQDVGAIINVTFDAPNTLWSGQYTISGIHAGSVTWCFVVGGVSTVGFTSPAGGNVAETYQPLNTIASLPNSMNPWSEYLVAYACASIRASRKQETSAFDRKLALLAQRLITATKSRTQGVQQAPITRRRRIYRAGYGGY